MSSVLSQTDEKVIESKSKPDVANQSGSATTAPKEDEICDDWEQLDQQVSSHIYNKQIRRKHR
jgi:hypothetical protein